MAVLWTGTVMVILFGVYSSPPFCMLGSSLSLPPLWQETAVIGPGCLLWDGWSPGLGVAGERDPWAASLGQVAAGSLEQHLGAFPADDSGL